MAKKMKADDAAKVKGVHPDDLKRVVGEVLHQKETASEYAGHAGKAMKDAIERHSLDRKALGVVIALRKADDQKRQTTLRCVIEYAHKLGFFDQVDAFDDVIGIMREIVAGATQPDPERKPAAPDAAAIAGMLN